MTSTWALLEADGTCVNVVNWDGNIARWNPAPLTAVPYDSAVHVVIPAAQRNAADLRTKMQAALDANVTYLGIANPTNAQNAAQVQRLTREATALIRLALNAIDSTDGT